MMSVETLNRPAAESGFRAVTVKRMMRLIDVMGKLSSDTVIGPVTAPKGGTALNLFHFDLDRLSRSQMKRTQMRTYGVKCTPHFAIGMIALGVAGYAPANLETIKAIKVPKKVHERFEPHFATAATP